jgi:hypothetical protein
MKKSTYVVKRSLAQHSKPQKASRMPRMLPITRYISQFALALACCFHHISITALLKPVTSLARSSCARWLAEWPIMIGCSWVWPSVSSVRCEFVSIVWDTPIGILGCLPFVLPDDSLTLVFHFIVCWLTYWLLAVQLAGNTTSSLCSPVIEAWSRRRAATSYTASELLVRWWEVNGRCRLVDALQGRDVVITPAVSW